jgi:hypothetical protein
VKFPGTARQLHATFLKKPDEARIMVGCRPAKIQNQDTPFASESEKSQSRGLPFNHNHSSNHVADNKQKFNGTYLHVEPFSTFKGSGKGSVSSFNKQNL